MAVRFYDVVLWIHITSVVVAFGVLFAYPLFLALSARAPFADRAAIHRVQVAFSKRVTGPAIGVVLIAGIYLATDAKVWDQGWVPTGFVLLLIIAGLGATVLRRGEERLIATAEAADEGAYAAAVGSVRTWTWIEIVLIVIAIFDMTAKPFT